MKKLCSAAVCGALAAAAPLAQAITFNDAVGDYVPGFAGSKAGDLDVVSSFVTYNQAKDTFVFSGTMNADIGTTPGGFYVWGVNRGNGAASFAANGFGGVLFDVVVIFNADGSGRVTGNNPTTFGAGTAKVIGSTIVGAIGGQFLPSTGFAKSAYTWNLWPRDGNLPAGFGQISDFAPDNSNLGVTVIGAVPEPASVALLLAGLGVLGFVAKRRDPR